MDTLIKYHIVYEDINSDGLSTDIYKKIFKIFKEHLLDKDAILKGLFKLS